MNWPHILYTIGLLALVSVLVWMLRSSATESAPGQPVRPPLIVLCAASNRGVIEEIAQRYAQDGGSPIQFQFGASQSLLTPPPWCFPHGRTTHGDVQLHNRPY